MPRKKKVTNAGGKREGAGRKKIYGEDTVLAQYSVPVSKFEIFDSAATEMLEQWKIKDGDGIKAKVDRAIEAGEIQPIGLMPNKIEYEKFVPIIPKEEIHGVIEEYAKKMHNDLQKIAPNFHFGENCKLTEEEMDKAIDEVLSEQFREEVTLQHEKDHSEPRYSETQIESLIEAANAKYKAGKIIKEVGTNEEYRLGYNLGFNKEINSVVMGGTSIENGLYKSEVVLFSNDEWAKF